MKKNKIILEKLNEIENELVLIRNHFNIYSEYDYLCLECYIKIHQFVKNYKFPEFIKTKQCKCSNCLKVKRCRKND